MVTNPFTMATMILMAEPVPAADGSGETVAAPNSAAPDAIGPAWSREDDVDDQQDTQRAAAAERESWHATWRKAGALLASGLALAAAIVVGFWVLGPHSKVVQQSPTGQPAPKDGATPPTAPATASAPAAAPSSIASTPDQDNKYVQALNDRGISFANPDAAIHNGKLVCDDIRQGMTVPQIIAAFRASNPALGNDANTYVTISVHTYCPQNNDLVGGG